MKEIPALAAAAFLALAGCTSLTGRVDSYRARNYCAEGDKAERQGYEETALWSYTLAIEAAPDWYDAYMRRGALYAARGDAEAAAADYEHALRLNPGDGQAQQRLAELRGEGGAEPEEQ